MFNETTIKAVPIYEIEGIRNYENFAKKLSIVVTSADSEFLKMCPHKLIKDTDLAMYVRIIWSNTEDDQYASTVVNHTIADLWNVDVDTLIEDAIAYSVHDNPIKFSKFMVKLNICSSEDTLYGARVLAYPTLPIELREKFGTSCYILPSSVHEILIMPDNGFMDVKELRKMVRDVNASEVSAKDKLTDSVYYFDIETGKIKLV